MTQITNASPRRRETWFARRFPDPENPNNDYSRAVLEAHKKQGLELAVKSRWIALAIIAVLSVWLNPRPEVLYYEVLLLAFAGIGWLQRRVGRVGLSRAELAVNFCDLTLMTIALGVPNPFGDPDLTPPIIFHFGTFIYFFVILAAGTLAFSWRTVIAIGTWTSGLWMGAIIVQWWFFVPKPGLTEAMAEIPGMSARMLEILDPNSFHFDVRIQEVVVFLIVAVTLGVSMRRFDRLLMGTAALERERANLTRYFSPNVVEELSQNDEPLKQIRTQGVAVMFVDIVGFTEYASKRSPEEVIWTLRDFHALMETEIFKYGGTLDKFLGDGLMATFGTPTIGPSDSMNAINCARAMMVSADQWNAKRRDDSEPEINVSIGLHFGEVVLGDIGVTRLEFAVIGNTVNVASRLEALTRKLGVSLVASDDLIAQARLQTADESSEMAGFKQQAAQEIRGVSEPLAIWTLS
ncbi:MAG: adenylate/guanylate cyclase domain-containing protein [Paracoccaceae bacterium]